MTERVRIKRPTWDDVTASGNYTLATVQTNNGADLQMLSGGDYVDIRYALSYAKDITGAELPITSMGIYGINAMTGEFQVDTTLFPDYATANQLCLCFSFGGNNYALGLTNNTANCY